jgi:Ceramidase
MSCNPYQQYFGINEGAIGGISADFAENNICGLIAQPANVMSSIAYVIAGIYFYYQTKNPIYSILLLLVGMGSIALHATVTRFGQILDFGAMFAIIMYFLYQVLKTSTNLKPKVIIYIITLLSVIESTVLVCAVKYRIAVLAVVLVALLFIETRCIIANKLESKLWNRGWIVFLLSFVIWLLDEYRYWDIDAIEHYFNAHAIWHIGTAYSLYIVSQYFNNKDLIENLKSLSI